MIECWISSATVTPPQALLVDNNQAYMVVMISPLKGLWICHIFSLFPASSYLLFIQRDLKRKPIAPPLSSWEYLFNKMIMNTVVKPLVLNTFPWVIPKFLVIFPLNPLTSPYCITIQVMYSWDYYSWSVKPWVLSSNLLKWNFPVESPVCWWLKTST